MVQFAVGEEHQQRRNPDIALSQMHLFFQQLLR